MINGQQAQAIEKMADGDNVMKIGFKRLDDGVKMPTRAHDNDSGFDIFANEDVVIAPGETKVIKTGLSVVLPEGYDAYIKNRSGVSSKTKLRVVSPPIDEGYRGEIGIIVDNIAQPQYYVEDGTLYEETSQFYQLVDGGAVGEPNLLRKVVEGTYLIRKGDKLAQMVVQPRPNTVAVEITDELDETDRGANGWGSSGV